MAYVHNRWSCPGQPTPGDQSPRSPLTAAPRPAEGDQMAGAGNSTGALTRPLMRTSWPATGFGLSAGQAGAACHHMQPWPATTQTCPCRDLTTKLTARGRMGRAGGPIPRGSALPGTLSQGAREDLRGLWHPGCGPPKLPILQGKMRAQREDGACVRSVHEWAAAVGSALFDPHKDP